MGAFGAMAFTVGTLLSLGKLMAAFYLACLIFILGGMGVIARVCGFSILRFIVYIKDEILIVLGTSSSESVLPRIMARLELLGCSKRVVGLVIPAGYSMNLDGTTVYIAMASVFIAQATNTSLLLTSKGSAGVTGSGFVVLAATLSAIPTIPVAGLAIIGIDRFMLRPEPSRTSSAIASRRLWWRDGTTPSTWTNCIGCWAVATARHRKHP